MTRKDIKQLIANKIVKLPLVDSSVADLLAVLNRPISNFSQIVDRLSPEVAARFLDMANSTNPGREVTSLSYAVQLLGYSHMKKILVSSILIDQFTRHLPDFDFKRFQTQSLFCAVLSRIIGKIIDCEKIEDLFTAGVLHNIGKQIIAVHFQEEHRKIIELKNTRSVGTREAEQEILGIGHAEIGAVVLEQFNIPRPVCDAVRFHNADPGSLPPHPEGELCRVVHAASRIVSRFTLPEAFPTLSLERQMAADIDFRKEAHKAAVAEAVRSIGYHHAFPNLLHKVAEGLMIDLKKQLRLRGEMSAAACLPGSGFRSFRD